MRFIFIFGFWIYYSTTFAQKYPAGSINNDKELKENEKIHQVLLKSGCLECHSVHERKLAPSFFEISERYRKLDEFTVQYMGGLSPLPYLTSRVRLGSNIKNKNWNAYKSSDIPNPRLQHHPDTAKLVMLHPKHVISDDDLKKTLQWILEIKN